FMRKVPPLHYSMVAEAQTESTTAIRMRTTPDAGTFDRTTDIYELQLIYFTAGAGAGQFARLSGVDPRTGIASLLDPDTMEEGIAEAIDDTTEYALVPWFNNFYPLLARKAALQFGKLEGSRMMADIQAHEGNFMEWLAPSDMAGGIPIKNDFHSDMGLNRGAQGGVGYGEGRIY